MNQLITGRWPTKTIGDVCQIKGGGTPSKSVEKYWQGSIPWVSPKDMKSDVITDSIDHISQEAIASSATSLIPQYSLLMVVRSGILVRTVPIAIAGQDITINQDIKALCPSNAVDHRFLYYFLCSKMEELLSMVSRGATVHRLMTDRIRSLNLPLPPLPEQKRIVAILDEAFAGISQAIANTERNLKNARELFESYLNDVFTRKGDGWVERPLSDLSEKITKGSSPKWQGINYVDSPGILFVTSENVNTNKMNFEKLKFVEDRFNDKDSKSILKIGDVLTNIVGASIGRTAIYDRDDLANINQAVCLIRCDEDKLLNKYLCHFLNSPFLKQLLHDNEVDNARANLSLGFFRSLKISAPDLLEQSILVKSLDAILAETEHLEGIYQQKLKALSELKQSILQKAFAGELTKDISIQ